MSTTLASIKFYKQYSGQAKYDKAIEKETKRYNKYKESILLLSEAA